MSINIDDFDFSIKPSEDFNLYVNGTWKKTFCASRRQKIF